MSPHALGILLAGIVTAIYGVAVNISPPKPKDAQPLTSSQLRDAVIVDALNNGKTEFSFTTDKPPLPTDSRSGE